MKHYLAAFLLCSGLILLSCSATDEPFIDNTTAFDSLGQGTDTIAVDTIYWQTDTLWIAADSIYFPTDTTATMNDTVIFTNPVSIP